jgi:hypothetical protein
MAGGPRLAVLFAIPATRDEFDAAARGDNFRDYARLLFGGDPPERVWSERYERIVAAAADLASAARGLGAMVRYRATLQDVRTATASCDVLVVLAHWRGWPLDAGDFLAAPPALDRCLRASGHAHLSPGPDAPLSEFARRLNLAIEHESLAAGMTVASPSLRAALNRDAIDEALGNGVIPGNAVELYDGLHPPGAFEEAIDPGFAGEIDLGTCTSIVVATMISRRRGAAIRLAHTVTLVDPLACCLAIAETLRRLAESGGPYYVRRLEVEQQLGELKRELARERRWR